jgi:type I restriction enzyme S subunit
LPLPPEDEQEAIGRFLNHANGRIERAIRAKRKLIALLNEQKQAIIHRAVTRGLDPTVPLKPSGIPWLGDIPKHWNITRLKFEASHIVDCLHATPTYSSDGGFPAIRTADIEPGRVRLEQARHISASDFRRWTERLKPEAGDILYSREGERYGIAALVPSNVSLCISQRMMVFRIKPNHCSEYVMWQLNCRHVYLQASCDIIGSTSPHVNVERIKNYLMTLPPFAEQEAIIAHIGYACAPLTAALAHAERQIELLLEYRTRLVGDVVTGKLDVREAVRHLPEAPAEPKTEPEDLLETETEEAEA